MICSIRLWGFKYVNIFQEQALPKCKYAYSCDFSAQSIEITSTKLILLNNVNYNMES